MEMGGGDACGSSGLAAKEREQRCRKAGESKGEGGVRAPKMVRVVVGFSAEGRERGESI